MQRLTKTTRHGGGGGQTSNPCPFPSAGEAGRSAQTTRPALALGWAWASPSLMGLERVQSSQTLWAAGTDKKSRPHRVGSELT